MLNLSEEELASLLDSTNVMLGRPNAEVARVLKCNLPADATQQSSQQSPITVGTHGCWQQPSQSQAVFYPTGTYPAAAAPAPFLQQPGLANGVIVGSMLCGRRRVGTIKLIIIAKILRKREKAMQPAPVSYDHWMAVGGMEGRP